MRKPLRWYRIAAEQGLALAQYNLGLMYGYGFGVTKDYQFAHMWLNIASANGYEVASRSRKIVQRSMSRSEIRQATELAKRCMESEYQECGE